MCTGQHQSLKLSKIKAIKFWGTSTFFGADILFTCLLQGFLAGFFGFPPFVKTKISKFQFDQDRRQRMKTSYRWCCFLFKCRNLFTIFLPLVYILLRRHQWFPNFSVLVELAWILEPLLLPLTPLHHTFLIVWCGGTWGLNCLLSLNNNSTVRYASWDRFNRGKSIWKRAWMVLFVSKIIIKISISSIGIGLRNSYFPLIHLASYYPTASYSTV